MLDALMATALVALSGATIVAVSTGMASQQDAALDRSVALVMAQSLMKQYLLSGRLPSGQLEDEDELFTYRVEVDAGPTTGPASVRRVAVVSRPKRGGTGPERLDFLTPPEATGPPS